MDGEGAAARPPRRGHVQAGSHVWVRPAPVRVELLTDPWSVWCWGFEPVRRAIQLRYPGLQFEFLLGGMFAEMPRPEEIGFDLERFFALVQRTTGMPIRADGVKLDPPKSTFPACVHVHAVRLVAPEKETAFLRALREAVYLDGLNISRPQVAEKIAQGLGVDPHAFREVLETGRAETAFQEQLRHVHARGLHGYPTLLFTLGERGAKVEGFQNLPAVLGIAESLSQRSPPPLPDPELGAIIPRGERVATREVAEVLGISPERAYDRLREAEEEGLLRRERYASGDAWAQVAPAR